MKQLQDLASFELVSFLLWSFADVQRSVNTNEQIFQKPQSLLLKDLSAFEDFGHVVYIDVIILVQHSERLLVFILCRLNIFAGLV